MVSKAVRELLLAELSKHHIVHERDGHGAHRLRDGKRVGHWKAYDETAGLLTDGDFFIAGVGLGNKKPHFLMPISRYKTVEPPIIFHPGVGAPTFRGRRRDES